MHECARVPASLPASLGSVARQGGRTDAHFFFQEGRGSGRVWRARRGRSPSSPPARARARVSDRGGWRDHDTWWGAVAPPTQGCHHDVEARAMRAGGGGPSVGDVPRRGGSWPRRSRGAARLHHQPTAGLPENMKERGKKRLNSSGAQRAPVRTSCTAGARAAGPVDRRGRWGGGGGGRSLLTTAFVFVCSAFSP